MSKRKLLYFLFLWIVVQIFPACALFTQYRLDKIDNYVTPANEFIDNFFYDSNSIYRGSYVGIKSQDNISYYQYQFNVLKQSNDKVSVEARILEILVPVDFQSKALVSETNIINQELSPAYIFTKYLNCEPSYIHKEITPAEYFKKNYPDLDIEDYRQHSIYFDIHPNSENIIQSSDDYKIKICYLDEFTWMCMEAEGRINWVIRNHLKAEAMKIHLFYTVPLDIVTFPFQIVLANMAMARMSPQ